MRNLFSVELEEYFHDEVFSEVADRRRWARYESRVAQQTLGLLDLLAARGARATFFVLGWTAERDPDLVREIAARGHEIASHGWSHEPADEQGERAFRRDVRRSRRILESIVHTSVVGYRAPGFSISERTPWAHRVLADEGFAYSSSVYPARLDGSGAPGAPPTPWEADGGDGRSVAEFPPLTRRLSGQHVPVAGGGYMRLLPVRVVSRAILAMNNAGAPAVICVRPWEIDRAQSRLPHAPLDQWRHWAGVDHFESKLAALLDLHDFGAIDDHLGLVPPRSPGSAAAHAI